MHFSTRWITVICFWLISQRWVLVNYKQNVSVKHLTWTKYQEHDFVSFILVVSQRMKRIQNQNCNNQHCKDQIHELHHKATEPNMSCILSHLLLTGQILSLTLSDKHIFLEEFCTFVSKTRFVPSWFVLCKQGVRFVAVLLANPLD